MNSNQRIALSQERPPTKCPNCSYVRSESDLIAPEWQCPHCGVVYAKFKTAKNKIVRVCLSSGREIEFNKVKLYDLDTAARMEGLRQLAARNFGPGSSGFGIWGSIELVAVASILTGLIGQVEAQKKAKEGLGQLTEVANLGKWIRANSKWVRVGDIENIKYPDVGLWKAVDTHTTEKRELVHIASEYVFVEINGKETAIFWDKVEQYELTEATEVASAIQAETQ